VWIASAAVVLVGLALGAGYFLLQTKKEPETETMPTAPLTEPGQKPALSDTDIRNEVNDATGLAAKSEMSGILPERNPLSHSVRPESILLKRPSRLVR
jgi:hypothetical protein